AKVLCVDHNLDSAKETVEMIGVNQGTAAAFKADVTSNADLKAMVDDAHARWGRIDILHNNVGVSLSGGDAELLDITSEAFDRCVAINLKSCIFAAKHVLPIMREQKSGVIINISSMAVITTYPYVAYKATKSAMVSFTEQLAYQNAQYG
ncbi:SDR family oxidoreductase, partial [Corallococcus praedator]